MNNTNMDGRGTLLMTTVTSDLEWICRRKMLLCTLKNSSIGLQRLSIFSTTWDILESQKVKLVDTDRVAKQGLQ